jgi:uncharacterized surface protein with fasciclin (FAS1) repeats
MREIAKSLMRFSWGMSLFGVRQATHLLKPASPSEQAEKIARALNLVTAATEENLDAPIKSVFKAGEQMQKGMVDMASQFLPFKEFELGWWVKRDSDSVGDETDSGFRTATEAPVKDILSTAIETGLFKKLFSFVQAAGLTDAVKAEGPFTVFAPTDDAFDKLPPNVLHELLTIKNQTKLQKVLAHHLVTGRLMTADISNGQSVRAVNRERLKFGVKNGGIVVNGAAIVRPDIVCTNGVIHAIDTVVMK